MVFPVQSFMELINELEKLPGVGPKTAQRLAFYMLKLTKEEAKALASSIVDMKEKIRYCSVCNHVTEDNPCYICTDNNRDKGIICVVENPSDVLALEKTREYRGVYHVLMGALSPLDGIGPDQLTVKQLVERVSKNSVKEIILATNPNAEGEVTAIYLSKLLKPFDVKVTRIAHGLPVGGDLEYADELTLAHALSGRREL